MSRKLTQGDSLDLLLDTICNTFGGVLFLSLLVVIMLNLRGDELQRSAPSDAVTARISQAQSHWKQTSDELASLRTAVARIEEIRQDLGGDHEAQQQILRLKSLSHEFQLDTKQREDSLRDLAQTRRTVNELLSEEARLEESIRDAERELTVAQSRLKKEVLLRSHTATIPRERTTEKEEVPFLVSNGRLCACYDFHSNGTLIENRRESRVREVAGERIVEPVTAQGTLISNSTVDLTALADKLKSIDRSKYFVAVVVWPDSFDQFAILRQQLIRLQLEYRLIPWSGEQPLKEGPVDKKKVKIQ